MAKNVNYYLIKTARFTGWLLLPLMLLFLGTGFVLCGKYGFDKLMTTKGALILHRIFDMPLVVLFVLHAVTSAYLTFRRWGWIRTKRRS